MLAEDALGVVSKFQLGVLPDVYLVCAVCSFRATQSAGSLGVANLTRLQVHLAGAMPFKTPINSLRKLRMSSRNSVRTCQVCSYYATLRRFRVSRGVRLVRSRVQCGGACKRMTRLTKPLRGEQTLTNGPGMGNISFKLELTRPRWSPRAFVGHG